MASWLFDWQFIHSGIMLKKDKARNPGKTESSLFDSMAKKMTRLDIQFKVVVIFMIKSPFFNSHIRNFTFEIRINIAYK